MSGFDKPLDGIGLAQVNTILNERLGKKQDAFTGQPGQVVGFGASGGAAAVRGWSNPNLLDNWYFVDPINQRGQAEYVGTGYGIDRWMSFYSNLTVSVDEDGLNFSIINADWGQLIPTAEFPEGEYTVSVLTSDGKFGALTKYLSGDNTDINASILTGMLGNTKYYCNLRRGWSATRGTLCAFQKRTGAAKLVAAKLEFGSQQTLAHQDAEGNWVLNDPPPNKALELAKCQKYQRVFNGDRSDNSTFFSNYTFLVSGISNLDTGGSSAVYFPVVLDPPMRAVPSITTNDISKIVLYTGNKPINSFSVFGPSLTDGNVTALSIRCDVNGLGYQASSPYLLNLKADGQIILDANL